MRMVARPAAQARHVRPRGRQEPRRPPQPAVPHEGGLPRGVSAQDVHGRPQGAPGVPHVQRLHGHARGDGLHEERPQPVGGHDGPLLHDGRPRGGRHVPDHAHVRPLQRRLRLLPRLPQGGALLRAGLQRQHGAPDQAHARLPREGLLLRRELRAAHHREAGCGGVRQP